MKRIEKDLSGSTQSFVGLSYLRSFEIPVPSQHEQAQITKFVGAITEQVQRLLEKLTQTQSLKKSLMQDLLTGKVRVKVD